jgi:Leucine-rich repeat (LRR) protein
LVSLSAGSPQTTDAGLASLAGMTKLQELRLRQSFVDGSGIAHLAGLQDLRVLDLSQCPVDDDAVVQLVRQHPRLEQLDLGYTRVTGAALPAIAQLKHLRRLNLSRTPVTVAELKTLGPDSPITGLDLYGTRVGDDLVEILDGIPNLQILDVYDAPRLTAVGIGELKRRVPNLHYDASRVSALTAAVADPPVPRVEDRRAEVSGPQFDAAALQAFPLPAEVDTLRISYTWGSDEDVRSLARFPQIEQLSVWSNGLTDAAHGRLHEFPRLRHFDLSHEWIGRAGIQEIARQTSLERLSLQDLPIIDADLAPLARLPQLRELRLSGTWLRGAFLADLENSPLELLQMDCQNLDDRNLEHLAKMRALDSIYLSHCPLTDVGAKALGKLGPVRVLRIDGSRLSDPAREELRRRVPGVVFADEDAPP